MECVKSSSELHAEIHAAIGRLGEAGVREALVEAVLQFENSPQLLDKHLLEYVGVLCGAYLERRAVDTVTAVFYTLAKVRGLRAVAATLAPDIYLVERVVSLAELAGDWLETYFLLAWLSILVRVPFPLASVSPALPERVWKVLVDSMLTASTKQHQVAAFAVSKFVTRADSGEYLERWYSQVDTGHASVTLVTGNYILKHARRETLEPHLAQHTAWVLSMAKEAPPGTAIVVVKNLKNLARVYAAAKKQVAAADAQIELVVTALALLMETTTTNERYQLARAFAKVARVLPRTHQHDILNYVLVHAGVASEDDYDLLDPDLHHCILLVVAEYLRERMIPRDLFPLVGSLLALFSFFHQRRLTHTVGTQCRDACAYICWAMYRGYAWAQQENVAEIMDVVGQSGQQLLLMVCFDPDLMVRRAAAAAVQELVGRFGPTPLLAGAPGTEQPGALALGIIEQLDFVALGNMERSYAIADRLAAQLPLLARGAMVPYLVRLGVRGFYPDQRRHSGETLARLVAVWGDARECVDRLLAVAAQEKEIEGVLGAVACLVPQVDVLDGVGDAVVAVVVATTYDFHRDPFHKADELLRVLGALCRGGYTAFPEDVYTRVFEAVRVGHAQVEQSFVELLPVLPLGPQHWDRLVRYVRLGNLALAKAVGGLDLTPLQVETLVALATDPKVQAESRACVVESLGEVICRGNVAPGACVVELLDDYTTTTQGDVGSKVRRLCLKVLGRCGTAVYAAHPHLRQAAEPKLLRLLCEVIDRIKVEAARLLLEQFHPEARVGPPTSGVYDWVLHIYGELYMGSGKEECVEQFWRGYCFSAGAQAALDATISEAFVLLMRWMDTVGTAGQLEALGGLLQVLLPLAHKPAPARHVAAQACALQLWVHVLDSQWGWPEGFAERTLYVRVYNLHLGSSSPLRVHNAIKVFVHLAERQVRAGRVVLAEPFKRLEWMCVRHPLATARQQAADGLVEAYTQIHSRPDVAAAVAVLGATDWAAQPRPALAARIHVDLT